MKREFLIIGTGIAVLAIIILIAFLLPSEGQVSVITDKSEYEASKVLKVKIENDSRKSICFSSCYPYYLEKKKEGKWKDYSYADCLTDNLVEKCISPGEVKAFELTLPLIDAVSHRLAIPACVGCSINEMFEEDERFYSNEFIIK